MVESVEHKYLSQCVTDVLSSLSKSNLYAYVEAERRKFDFACEMTRDWSRPLVGQTLWNHTAGVDKDVRTMLLDRDAEICVYVARDTMRARRLLSEALRDYKSSGAEVGSHRLRVFWIPADFDADIESQRNLVDDLLHDRVARDIVMTILLGNLTSRDVRFFVRTSGIAGLHFALLFRISTTTESLAPRELSSLLNVSTGAVREKLLRLLGCGFLEQFGGGASIAHATLRGRVFLDFCGQLWRQASAGRISAELVQILRLLDMRYSPAAVRYSADALHLAGPLLTEVPETVTGRLLATISAAVDRWDVDLDSIVHSPQLGERPNHDWKGATPLLDHFREESELVEIASRFESGDALDRENQVRDTSGQSSNTAGG